ncbi:MBL fold metallo-hydrolase [Akkermansiaceae bacterium]|nr:MBL fold metallo-hydrolase [Akkermansiaceae bacterium]MDB4544750.1 MBL fold metallo-hydrolase [Akkermansiaceae bacterium]
MSTCSDQSRFLFLGTATSVGVPVIGCPCPTCSSDHPHDRRLRSSAFIEGPWGRLLIDTGPDLHEQALRAKISAVDAVLYTHEHLDHVAGFDEIRAFCWRRDAPLPLYGSAETLAGLDRMFPWAFLNKGEHRGYVHPDPRPFEEPFEFNGLKITPIEVNHGWVRTHGFRFDFPGYFSLAYLPDVKSIPDSSLSLLRGLDILVIDALRYEDHQTHMTIPEALATINTLQPRQAYFTHISHEINREETAADLPQNVSLAFDGLSLNLLK